MLALNSASLSPSSTTTTTTSSVKRATNTANCVNMSLSSLKASSPPACNGVEQNTRESYIARLMSKFEESLNALGATDAAERDRAKLESMSNFIYESMAVSTRNYHSVQHVFNLIDGHVCSVLDAVAVLAALFHDCVYFIVDGGLSTLQREKLEGAILEEAENGDESNNATVLRSHPDSNQDPLLRMTLAIFGFSSGQVVTGTGDNEFLSAVIAVRELQPLVSFKVLAQVAVCIEATIPFRAKDESGATALDRLYSRLVKANSDLSLGLTDSECVEAVQRAAMVANEDVGNFGTLDHALFLDNTWSLLPETNEALRSGDHYTVDQFRIAVSKMHGFFSFVKPGMVFQEFQGVPDTDTLNRVTENAARNIEVGAKYVAAKLVSASLLAAFATLSGGDAPMSLFMGAIPSLHSSTRRLEDVMNDERSGHPLCGVDCDPVVYQLLAEGRQQDFYFDVKRSPLSAYLYPFIGDSGVNSMLDQFDASKMTAETATAFLTALPRELVSHVAAMLAELASSRKEQVMGILQALPVEN